MMKFGVRTKQYKNNLRFGTTGGRIVMANENQHLTEYLDFYIANTKPKNYAVLLDGDWGSGKTHFINQFRDARKDKHKFLYISLYGVSETSEIEDQIFQQLHPTLASKPVSIATKILKGALKSGLEIDLEGTGLTDFLKRAGDSILIFDDLERCSIPVEKMLGYINRFAEHENHRVIIIANENEILKSASEKNVKPEKLLGEFKKFAERANHRVVMMANEALKPAPEKNAKYLEIKEKLIGRTFSVSANAAEALGTFLTLLDDSVAKSILVKNNELILRTYTSSEYNNLRSLKQVIIEWPRFFGMLPEKAQKNETLISEALQAMLVISFEIRKATIDVELLKTIATHNYRHHLETQEKAPNPIEVIEKKYTSFQFEKLCPTDVCWYSFFKEGYMPENILKQSIDNSVYFRHENTTEWVKLWYFTNLEETEFNTLLKSVKKDFDSGKYCEHGVIKHIAGMYLYFSRNKVVKETPKQIASWISENIKKLSKEGKLKYEMPQTFRIDDGYGSLGYMDKQSDEFKEIAALLKKLNEAEEKRNYPTQASALVKMVEHKSRKFWEALSYRHEDGQKFSKIPILSFVKPETFLDAFMKCPNQEKEFVIYAFKDRYTMANHNRELLLEEKWLKDLKKLMLKTTEKAEPLAQYVLKGFCNQAIDPALKILAQVKKPEPATATP